MIDYFEKVKESILGHNDFVWFIGVVEDNADPMALGRVRARCFNFHPEDRTDVPTESLPWSVVLQPTTSAAISGIGNSPNGLELGSWVMGFFADGEDAQQPFVMFSIPGVHRPNPPGVPGGSGGGYLNQEDYYSGGSQEAPQQRPYHNEKVEGVSPNSTDLSNDPNSTAQGEGALIAAGDVNMMLTLQHQAKWTDLGLSTYDWTAAPNGYACKDGKGSLRFHYGTALALEKLTKEFGKGKLSLTSAYRTPAYNARLSGAARNSQHIHGRALDISLGSIGGQSEIIRFAKLAVKNGFVGFGLYPSFIHIDTGTGRVWNRAKQKWFVDAIRSVGWYEGKPGLKDVKVNSGTSAENPAATPGETLATSPEGFTTTKDVEKYTREYLKNSGRSDEQIAGIMGHIKTESGFDPNALNKADSNGLPSYGLFQLNGSRFDGLKAYSSANGLNYQTAEAQLKFFDYELTTTESKAGNLLSSSSSVYESTRAMSQYERHFQYTDPNSAESQKRLTNANQFYKGTNFGSQPLKGFVDPTNSLPFADYRGEASTHVNARGFNHYLNQQKLMSKNDARVTGIPAAGDIGTFGEPELASVPQYPYNKTTATKSGHIIELDDSPGSERINIEHKSGSGVEIFADGKKVERTKGNHFMMDQGDAYHAVLGKHMLTSINDMHIRSTADLTQQSDGSTTIIVGNDGTLIISGDYTLSVGEDLKLKGNKVFIEGASVDIYSSGNMNLEAEGNLELKAKGNMKFDATGTLESKAGGKLNMQSGGNMGIKAPTVYMDDVVRVAEDGAPTVTVSEGAQNSDLGTPPARKIINKDNLKNTANASKVITTDEAAQHYSTEE